MRSIENAQSKAMLSQSGPWAKNKILQYRPIYTENLDSYLCF